MGGRKQRHDRHDARNCPMETALDLVGGKWKGVILFRLGEGTKRFNELSRLLCRISARVLTVQLRELERDGLIERRAYPEVPPRVEYDLTELGRTILPILAMLKDWGDDYLDGLENADAA